MCKPNKLNNENGFTLIEVMIALMVLTIGILGMMVMQTTAINSNHRASSMSIASSIAAGQIEILRNRPFAAVAGGIATDPATAYPISWTVANIAGLPDARQIIVTVNRPRGMQPVIYQYTKFRNL